MKPLIIASVLALATPYASAGDFSFDFGYRKHGGIRIGIGYKDGHRHRKHRHREHCHKHWVKGYYTTHARRVHVPGHYDRVRVPAKYAFRYDDCGVRIRVLVRRVHYRKVWVPARYETRYVKHWHPGHWEYVCNTRGHCH